MCRRHGRARRHRGPDARRQAAHRPARPAPGGRRHIGGHRQVGRRKDHVAAQPRGVVALHVRHADAAVWAERDDVPFADALCAAWRPARGRELPEGGRRHRRPDADPHDGEGVATASRRSARRGAG
ncbi:MAG: hypothetical protein WAL26_25360, partial [Mycobacterium sp.]